MGQRKIINLLKEVDSYKLKGDSNLTVSGIALDSRKVKDGYLFVALRGVIADGHQYIDKAIGLGARAILCEEWPNDLGENVTYVKVKNARKTLGLMANNYYNYPSEKLKCVGITGTNGKTSIATLLYDLFKELGYKVGLISTVEILVNEKKWDAILTTPDVINLHRLMSEMVAEGCTHVFMEVSSHALDQQRIAGVKIVGGVFTNITHDHLDYHGDFASYIRAKQSFFSGLDKEAFALTNVDDKNGEVMIQNSKARCFRYSLRLLTDYKTKVLSQEEIGMQLNINGHKFITRLAGRFNAANLTAVYATALLLEDFKEELLIRKISGLQGVKGRMEVVSYRPRVIVDYAHTPDALSNVLDTLRASLSRGRLIVIVGCGGDRDKKKRPIMGAIAIGKSDLVIFTSDNPRTEDPQSIIDDMTHGLDDEDMLEIVNRKVAIKTALKFAKVEDTVLIAGKGHEDYQEINNVKHFFSDQQVVKDILSK